jgi:hypothetical protein
MATKGLLAIQSQTQSLEQKENIVKVTTGKANERRSYAEATPSPQHIEFKRKIADESSTAAGASAAPKPGLPAERP